MERTVRFNSDGFQIAGVLFEPEATPNNSCPAVVLCQGMVGVKEYFWFPYIARRLVELGYVALIWDYRGVGESEGERRYRRTSRHQTRAIGHARSRSLAITRCRRPWTRVTPPSP